MILSRRMMKRSLDARIFRNSASKTRSINISVPIMRGGIRL